MKFKLPHLKTQFDKLPSLLKEITYFVEDWAHSKGKQCIITRVTDPVKGESGVHPAGRAVDIRDETSDGQDLFTDAEIEEIVSLVNATYPRKDGRVVALHHSFKGMPRHIHLQVPFNLEKGIVKHV